MKTNLSNFGLRTQLTDFSLHSVYTLIFLLRKVKLDLVKVCFLKFSFLDSFDFSRGTVTNPANFNRLVQEKTVKINPASIISSFVFYGNRYELNDLKTLFSIEFNLTKTAVAILNFGNQSNSDVLIIYPVKAFSS